jgi:hypothetical protein
MNIIYLSIILIGLHIILLSIYFAFLWIVTKRTNNKAVIAVTIVAVTTGLALIIHDRITELTVRGVGTIKAAAVRAISDAKSVADLKEREENQSATVDLVAGQASKAKEVSEEVAEQNKRAEQKLGALDNAINKATATLGELKSAAEFTMTVVAAQNDDRTAFDKLRKWADDKTLPFSTKAEQAWNTIFADHTKPFYIGGFTVSWKDGFDPSKLGIGDLAQQYQIAPAQLRPALLEYIWKRSDISKLERLNFLINVMRSDSSLTAVEYSGRYFTEGTGQQIAPLAVENLTQWWDNHRAEFGGK